jgi:ribosome-binding protein aMBF1 (putative translation factor)
VTETRVRSHGPPAERFGPRLAIKIGQTLREARAASGLSVHRVADETAISPQFLEAIESGTAVVTIQVIERIAEVVGWHWERLFFARPRCICCGGGKERPDVDVRA